LRTVAVWSAFDAAQAWEERADPASSTAPKAIIEAERLRRLDI
jgi:hypothetical protein